jgi:hypothetical protein
MHKVKVVPCFLFFDEGAVVERISLRDIRMMRGSKEIVSKGRIHESIHTRTSHTHAEGGGGCRWP